MLVYNLIYYILIYYAYMNFECVFRNCIIGLFLGVFFGDNAVV